MIRKIEYWQCFKEKLMIDEKRWNHRLVTVPIILLTTIFIVWASITEVDEVVRGEGRVIPSSKTKIIQHYEGGIIKKIYVKEGQRVKKGDPIYRLENAKSQADSKSKAIAIISYKAQINRLEAEVYSRDINFDQDISDDIKKNELDIYHEDMKNYQDKLNSLKDKVTQAKLEKRQKITKLKNLKNELKTQNENLSIAKKLLDKGAGSKKQYLSELSKKQSLQTNINDLKNSIPILDKKISVAKNDLESFKSEKKSELLKKIAQIKTKIKQLKEEESAGADREVRKVVLSPVDGIVKKLYFHTIGGVVKPGDRIAEITPIDDNLVIEAKIKTNDRGRVIEGQKVTISITAYSYTKYGLLNGKLISISPDSFVEQNGKSYYQVRISADKTGFSKDKPILPGMVANINILTGKKTIMEYILKPLKDITINALREQ